MSDRDETKLSGSTVRTLEHVSTHFAHVYWNMHYEQAKTLCLTNKSASITDAYKNICLQYLTSCQDHRLVRCIFSKLHEYYIKYVSASISYGTMTDAIVKEIIPESFYSEFDQKQRDRVLVETIVKSIADFTVWINTPVILKLIIDADRSNLTSPEIISIQKSMQEKMFSIMLTRRNECQRKLTTGRVDAPDEELQENMRRLTAENTAMRNKVRKAIGIIDRLEKENNYLKNRIMNTEREHKATLTEIDSLKRQLAEAKHAPVHQPSPKIEDLEALAAQARRHKHTSKGAAAPESDTIFESSLTMDAELDKLLSGDSPVFD